MRVQLTAAWKFPMRSLFHASQRFRVLLPGRLLLALHLGVLFGLGCGLEAQAERAPSPFGVSASLRLREGQPVLRVLFAVPEQHVIYADHLRFEAADGTSLTPARLPAPVVARDKATGKERKMYDRPFAADFRLGDRVLTNLVVKLQGCSNSACYFPEKRTFVVTEDGVFAEAVHPVAPPIKVAVAPDAPSEDWKSAGKPFHVVGRATGFVTATDFVAFLNKSALEHILADDEPLARFKRVGLAASLFFIVIGGAGLNLTPCVLPLIPINLALIGAGARARSRRHGFWYGAIYGAGMAVVYGILGLVVVLTGSKFGTLNSSVWFNSIIAIVFVALALAMFGALHLDFSRFQTGTSTTAGASSGGRSLMAFGMGALSALLAGACVAPVVISVLLLATSLYSKGMVAGLALPFLLGLGMAAPWPFAGAGLGCLPKPGRWMTWVKRGFGVLILIFAFYYAQTAYGLLQTRRSMSVLAAAPAGAVTPVIGANQSLAQALRQAEAGGQFVLVDFQASWCKNCAAMEELTFTRTNVQKRLKDFIVVKYQAERPNEPPAREVLDHFGVMGLPTFVVLAPKSSP
jgi:thiol:disulfide interchange protein